MVSYLLYSKRHNFFILLCGGSKKPNSRILLFANNPCSCKQFYWRDFLKWVRYTGPGDRNFHPEWISLGSTLVSFHQNLNLRYNKKNFSQPIGGEKNPPPPHTKTKPKTHTNHQPTPPKQKQQKNPPHLETFTCSWFSSHGWEQL